MSRYKSEKVVIKGIPVYIDGYYRSNMELMKLSARKKFDNVIIIDGMEGLGKTTLAINSAYYLTDGNFTLDDIVFTPKQFFEKVKKAKPGSAIVFDEFIMSGLSTDAFNRVQTDIIKILTVVRKKNFFIILVIPYFFMLRKYFAVARSKCLIHIYSPDGLTRGFFKFYNYSQKKTLFLKGKSDYKYNVVEHSFHARFYDTTTWQIIDEKAYDSKKEEAISMIGMSDSQLTKLVKLQEKLNFIKYMMLNDYQTFRNATGQKNRGFEIVMGLSPSNFTPQKIDELRKWYEVTLEDNIHKHIETKYVNYKSSAKVNGKEVESFEVFRDNYMAELMAELSPASES